VNYSHRNIKSKNKYQRRHRWSGKKRRRIKKKVKKKRWNM
jgi:hypothetical protein